MRRIISVLLENEAGALSRVIGLFAQRNYNIESLTVAPTDDQTLSRLTLTTSGSDHEIEQITKQLNKLIEVVKLVDLTDGDHIERELMLIKLKASGAQRDVEACFWILAEEFSFGADGVGGCVTAVGELARKPAIRII